MTLSTLALKNCQRRALAEAIEGGVCQSIDFSENQAYLPSFEPIQNCQTHLQTNYVNSKNNLGSRSIETRGKYSTAMTVPA